MEQRVHTAGRARLWDGAHGLFWREAARRPRSLGAVVPSSRALARAMAMAVPAEAVRVAELGAGTGALTRGLWERGFHPAHCLLVEPNPVFAAHLRRSWPTARVIQGYRPGSAPDRGSGCRGVGPALAGDGHGHGGGHRRRLVRGAAPRGGVRPVHLRAALPRARGGLGSFGAGGRAVALGLRQHPARLRVAHHEGAVAVLLRWGWRYLCRAS